VRGSKRGVFHFLHFVTLTPRAGREGEGDNWRPREGDSEGDNRTIVTRWRGRKGRRRFSAHPAG
jgi:hypothetical protein